MSSDVARQDSFLGFILGDATDRPQLEKGGKRQTATGVKCKNVSEDDG